MPEETNINFGKVNLEHNEQLKSSNNFWNNHNNIKKTETSIMWQVNEINQTNIDTQNKNINLEM